MSFLTTLLASMEVGFEPAIKDLQPAPRFSDLYDATGEKLEDVQQLPAVDRGAALRRYKRMTDPRKKKLEYERQQRMRAYHKANQIYAERRSVGSRSSSSRTSSSPKSVSMTSSPPSHMPAQINSSPESNPSSLSSGEMVIRPKQSSSPAPTSQISPLMRPELTYDLENALFDIPSPEPIQATGEAKRKRGGDDSDRAAKKLRPNEANDY